MDLSNLWIAFLLTLFAGLSTGIGSFLAFFTKKTNTKLLSVALGFSAGVMIYISFVELLDIASESLSSFYGEKKGKWLTAASFFSGIFIIGIIDRFIPSFENPHEVHKIEALGSTEEKKVFKRQSSLYRTGMFTALAIAIHNFPEGLATFVSALKDPQLGFAIAFAIAIHNIPEGIAVSFPIFYATENRKKAFFYSFLSGLAEPVGAIVGFWLFSSFIDDATFGFIMGSIAGIMVFISLDELLPAAEEYGEHHLSIYGLIAGMAVMALSLLLFL